VTTWSVLVIALAGAVGTALRHAVGMAFVSRLGAGFPFGTLFVNLLGSALLGVVAQVFAGQTIGGTDARLVLGVGLLGGFTTYSSFNLELLRMLEEGAFGRAAGYLLATLAGCLLAGAAGIAIARVLGSGVQPS
jgi:CrcB protein